MSPRFSELYTPLWYLRTDGDNRVMTNRLADNKGYGMADQDTIDEKKKQKGKSKRPASCY